MLDLLEKEGVVFEEAASFAPLLPVQEFLAHKKQPNPPRTTIGL